MLVDGNESELRNGLERRQAIQPVLEDRVHVPIGAGADGERAGAGGFEPGGPVAPAEPEQPEARAVALFRMRTVGEDRLYEGGGLWPDGFRPLDQPRRCPLEMMLMRLGHVGG